MAKSFNEVRERVVMAAQSFAILYLRVLFAVRFTGVTSARPANVTIKCNRAWLKPGPSSACYVPTGICLTG